MVLQYIVSSTGRKAEVLKLMAQVLEFDSEMQQRVRARACVCARVLHATWIAHACAGWTVRQGLDVVAFGIAVPGSG